MSHFSCVLFETKPVSGASAIVFCLHPRCVPAWNASAAQYQTETWVREHYPRYFSICSECSQFVTAYACIEHARSGGWLRAHTSA